MPHWGLDLVEPGERFTVADWKEYALKKIEEIRERGHVPMVVGGTGLYIDSLIYDYRFDKKCVQERGALDREKMCSEYLVFGIKWTSDELRERICKRVDNLFTQKLYEETKMLVKKYGWNSQAMKSDIYQFAWGYLQGKYSLEEAKKLCVFDDWHLAKRQMTWFKRNDNIIWVELAKMKSCVLKCIQDE